MNDDSAAPVLDFRAVGKGTLWGLALMLIAGIVQGILGFRSPYSLQMEGWLTLLTQILGALLAGFQAARRASGAGWMHGGMAGLATILTTAVLSGVTSALPGMVELLKMLGLGTGVGLLGGVVGVNLAER